MPTNSRNSSKKDIVHGAKGYRRGCRCSACRRGWAKYCQGLRQGGRTRATRGRAFFPGKANVPVSSQLTPLGDKILREAVRRTGRSRGDVLEQLLRTHGGTVAFPAKAEGDQ